MLEIRLLGQFELRRDGETLSLPSRPAQSLLAYLVLNPGIHHRREQLAGLIAPDADEAGARSILRHAIWRIRKTLGRDLLTGRDYLVVDEIAASFDPLANYWLDVAVVCARHPPDALPQAVTAALDAYAGDLLPGFYDDWIVLERERVEAAFEGKMRHWLERLIAGARWDEVLDWGERWIALGHSPEYAYAALMQAHAAQCDASRVVATYQRCVDDLKANLSIGPAASTRRLYERLVRGEETAAGGAEKPVVQAGPFAGDPERWPPARVETFLVTKLCIPPRRPGVITRHRLHEKLDAGMILGMTLVSAPAGSGKTTLVAEWLRHAGCPAAWLSLDEGDNDPARFFTYLLAALRQIEPLLGAAAEAMLGAPQPPPPEALLTSLINDLAALSRPFTLVLDDFHAIHHLPIHQQVGFLLDHRPQTMHVVVVSREDPRLSLACFRARFHLVEVRQADLSFSVDETAQFLRDAMRLALHPADVAALHDRTEGWIAGLQLAALSVQDRVDAAAFLATFSGSNRYVADYLLDEVFRRQPPDVQAFLLQTSILERLCAGLCEAVLATDGQPAPASRPPQEMLDHLERTNLFIAPLDSERCWYRYHHLFAELLQNRVRADLGGRVDELHLRASRWHAANGYATDAIRHALAAQSWELAAGLMSQACTALLRRGEIATLLAWYGALPASVVQSNSRLCLDYAWPLLLAGRVDLAGELLARAEALAAASPPTAGGLREFLGSLAAAQSYLARARGNLPRSAEFAHRALALLPENDAVTRSVVGTTLGLTYWHGGRMAEAEAVLLDALAAAERCANEYARLAARIFLARVASVRGELRRAARVCHELIQENSLSPIITLAHLDLASLYYEWNDLNAASEFVRTARNLAAEYGNPELQVAGELVLARIRSAHGDLPAALESVRAAEHLARSQDLPPFLLAGIAAAGVEISLFAGELDEAERWAAGAAPDVHAHPFYRFLDLTQPCLLLAQGDRAAAATALDACYHQATRAGWGWGAIAVRVWQALAAGSPGALPFLSEALRRGQPGGFIRTFADAGPSLAPLLEEAARQGVTPGYTASILRALDSKPPPARTSPAHTR